MAKKAKKAKKAKSARKKFKPMKAPKVWTADLILKDWRSVLDDALKGKKLDAAIDAAFSKKLLDKIQEHLDNNEDYNVVRPGTHKVARTLGVICRLLTLGTSVSLAVFEITFKLCKLHPACPAGGGSGQWCDV